MRAFCLLGWETPFAEPALSEAEGAGPAATKLRLLLLETIRDATAFGKQNNRSAGAALLPPAVAQSAGRSDRLFQTDLDAAINRGIARLKV